MPIRGKNVAVCLKEPSEEFYLHLVSSQICRHKFGNFHVCKARLLYLISVLFALTKGFDSQKGIYLRGTFNTRSLIFVVRRRKDLDLVDKILGSESFTRWLGRERAYKQCFCILTTSDCKQFKQESIPVGCIPPILWWPPLDVSWMLGIPRGGGDTQINCLHSQVLGLLKHCFCVYYCPLTPKSHLSKLSQL